MATRIDHLILRVNELEASLGLEPVKIEEWSTLPPPDVTVQVTVAPASGFPD